MDTRYFHQEIYFCSNEIEKIEKKRAIMSEVGKKIWDTRFHGMSVLRRTATDSSSSSSRRRRRLGFNMPH